MRFGPRILAMIVVASMAVPAIAQAQGPMPVGPEFRVNSYTTNLQGTASIAIDAAGNFVVVWQSWGQDGDNYGVFGQRYNNLGMAVGTEFQVNSYTTQDQGCPAVASDAAGNFVVVWYSNDYGYSVLGQRFSNLGVPLGTEFQVSPSPPYGGGGFGYPALFGFVRGQAVASDAAGNFVVVWQNEGSDGSQAGIFGQRFASSGAFTGTEFQVNTYTTYDQKLPSVSTDALGNFVVVWESRGQDAGTYGIFGQRFNSSGAKIGPEFLVNTYTTDDQKAPAVSSNASGEFVVVWHGPDGAVSSYGVFGRRFGSNGIPIGTEFQVNTYTSYDQAYASVAVDGAGNFIVSWVGDVQDGGMSGSEGVFGQRFSNSGVQLGTEFLVNTYTPGRQTMPSVASDTAGNFVIAWNGDGSTDYGVFAQRFQVQPHDSVVIPPKPMTVAIPSGVTSLPKKLHVKVVNADILPAPEALGHVIKLIATDGTCPSGTIAGSPDFGSGSDTVTLIGGKSKSAVVPLAISSVLTTFNSHGPARCTLNLEARTLGASDPTLANNFATVELNVIDKGDPPQADGAAIRSLRSVRVILTRTRGSIIRNVAPKAVNADTVSGSHPIKVVASPGTCPPSSVGVVDLDTATPGIQDTVTVETAKTKIGKLPLSIDTLAFTSPNAKAPARCTALISIAGATPDTSNDTTQLIIDVIDRRDFMP